MKWEMEVEEKEMEAMLEKILDLHDKFSDAILSISRAHFRSSVKSRRDPNRPFCFPSSDPPMQTDSDQNPAAALREAKSLNAIRTALEDLENQLDFLRSTQAQQQAERDVALARLEQSRIMLSMRLAEYQGKKYEFIEEAEALVGENIFVNETKSPRGNFVEREGQKSNVLFNALFSSFNFVKQSLQRDHVGGMLGNAAMVAVSMFALMRLQQPEVFHNANLTRVSRPAVPSARFSELDVLSARG
ncbi:hypothetical protein DM860_010951 [Cuscuta australis]|uniref:Plastid division protein PDV1 n=1 Tax=Cuscuta australis TaxID=267555 RepID=A0A328E4B6_9ASTE|nr:hypothetical protein DM860_010951 [Cuscuta australis]